MEITHNNLCLGVMLMPFSTDAVAHLDWEDAKQGSRPSPRWCSQAERSGRMTKLHFTHPGLYFKRLKVYFGAQESLSPLSKSFCDWLWKIWVDYVCNNSTTSSPTGWSSTENCSFNKTLKSGCMNVRSLSTKVAQWDIDLQILIQCRNVC